ncbi:Metallo-dependent hydrolase [Dentipellis sp. KUC8613]|nr:Metallo-dependent hydrolase [Dentipellis sp. KUC8613]
MPVPSVTNAKIYIQINGAYNFGFSVYDGHDEDYIQGLKHVASKIVETGVTSFLPTIITQETSLYPKLLHLLRPVSGPDAACVLGWHAEGPFLQLAKRGAHAPSFLRSAKDRIKIFEDVYGTDNLAESEDWLMGSGADNGTLGVHVITAAPEVEGTSAHCLCRDVRRRNTAHTLS